MSENKSSEQPSAPPKQTRPTAILKNTLEEIGVTIIGALITTLLGAAVNITSDQLWSRYFPSVSLLVVVGTVMSISITLFAVFTVSLNLYRQQAKRRNMALEELVHRDREFFNIIEDDVSRLLGSEVE